MIESKPRARAAAALLVLGGVAALTPAVTAPIALAAGVLLALTVGNPWAKRTGKGAGVLLRACIVGLGFGMSLGAVANAAAQGLAYTVIVVFTTFGAGLLLGRLLRVEPEASLLISSGTSICGGSAIAAVGSTVGARGETMSAALGIVFVLNAVALYAFPLIGRALELSQTQFAIWAAVAIHDTSSVVAAAGLYGAQALEHATVLKLARTLWLIPLVAGLAWTRRSHAATSFPWFPVLFLLAVVLRSLAPTQLEPLLATAARGARAALPLVLFLIGSSITPAGLRRLGARPILQAVLLWLAVATAVLAAVLAFSR